MWDIFISYASEDKDTIVDKLVTILKSYELKVWYSEIEVSVGDSLTKAIDRGLSDSSYGLIILSKSFIEKTWTDYEFRGLLSKEVNRKQKIILPIWHHITVDEVAEYCPYLGDKVALSTDMDIEELALKIISVVKPDLINSMALKHQMRKLIKNSDVKEVEFKNIHVDDKIRHNRLPRYFVVPTKLMCDVLGDVTDMDYVEVLKDFARDADYDMEYIVWNAIACTYIKFIRDNDVDFKDINSKREIFAFLMTCSLNQIVDLNDWSHNHPRFQLEQYGEMKRQFAENCNFFLEILGVRHREQNMNKLEKQQ